MSGRDRIRGEGISYTYLTRTGETLALQNLSLSVRDGEFCSIVGPSGCGKSTLLAIISGLLRPTEGEIYLDGSQVRGTNERVGILLQKDHLFEWRTVLQNAELGLEILGKSTAQARRRAHQLLESYGLGGFEKSYPYQLSGGMRQRVALIRTLATDPDILLLDEPFSALDYQTKLILERDVHGIIRDTQDRAARHARHRGSRIDVGPGHRIERASGPGEERLRDRAYARWRANPDELARCPGIPQLLQVDLGGLGH